MTKVRDFICSASLMEETLFSRLIAKSWRQEQRNDRLSLKATRGRVCYLGLVVEGAPGIVILELLFLASSFTHLERQRAEGEATLSHSSYVFLGGFYPHEIIFDLTGHEAAGLKAPASVLSHDWLDDLTASLPDNQPLQNSCSNLCASVSTILNSASRSRGYTWHRSYWGERKPSSPPAWRGQGEVKGRSGRRGGGVGHTEGSLRSSRSGLGSWGSVWR